MLIVRPYGQSVVGDKPNQRQLRISDGSNKDFEEFNATTPKILIAQWISVIDKIIQKPNQSDVANKGYINDRKQCLKAIAANVTENDKRRKVQIDFRNKLGELCWKMLTEVVQRSDWHEYGEIWKWKLNPAGDNYLSFKNDKITKGNRKKKIQPKLNENYELRIRGHWYSRFLRDESEEDVDFNKLAKEIHKHLHHKEFKKFEGYRGHRESDDYTKPRTRGLITARALSISKNTLQNRINAKLARVSDKKLNSPKLEDLAKEVQNLGWSEEDEKTFTVKSDLAAKIYELNLEAEKNHRKISSREAAQEVFDHYKNQFEVDGEVPSRQEISNEQIGLLNLYDAVRAYYKKFLSNTKKGTKDNSTNQKRTKLSTILPKSNEKLFSLLKKRQLNASTNDLVRLGKVIHYEASEGSGDGFILGDDASIWENSLEEIAQSPYWTTNGQSEIKRTEAFVRVWRHSIGMGARTARAIGDPLGELKDGDKPADITSSAIIFQAINRFGDQSENNKLPEQFRAQLKVLFGEKADLFLGTHNDFTVDEQQFFYFLLKLTSWIRHRSFHYKGRRAFIKTLSNVGNSLQSLMRIDGSRYDESNTKKAILQLLSDDQDARIKRYWNECEGAALPYFANENQMKEHLKWIIEIQDNDVVLPKFNSMLLRIHHTKLKDQDALKRMLPQPASRVALKNEALRAKFVGLKQLYEEPFTSWLEQNAKGERLAGYIESAIKLGTDEAKKFNSHSKFKGLIVSKPERLRGGVEEKKSISSYMIYLQQMQASEMRIQKGYESNSEAAKKQMEWIENFRKDIIGRAFVDFLCENKDKTGWLTNLTDNSPIGSPVTEPNIELRQTNPLSEVWHAVFYTFFHLIPADDISMLLHQFKKWAVLEGKADHSDSDDEEGKNEINEFRRLMVLYLEMHDDKHSGEGVEKSITEPFKGYFDTERDYETIFNTQGSDDEVLGSTRRGLREILRFGHLKPLSVAIGNEKITSQEVSELLALERSSDNQSSKIAIAQTERKELHDKIVQNRGKPTREQLDKYSEYLDTIERHSHLARKVRLNNPIRLHRLMMRVASRLVDYSGTWERDGYFITLALIKLLDKKPEDIFNCDKAKKAFQNEKKWGWSSKIDAYESGFGNLLNRYHPISEDISGIRNDFAHFNYLAEADVDLTKAVNDARILMSYDRKLKNAVSKSIIDILFQEGFFLKWEIDKQSKFHTLKLENIGSRQIPHLAGKLPRGTDKRNYTKPMHAKSYVKMVKQLFVENALA